MADNLANVLLGWLKVVANWVLKLFNLAQQDGTSPLVTLARLWLPILAVILIAGTVTDLVIWLIRWRPYWIWTHKKRVIINDSHFFDDKRKRPAARAKADPLFETGEEKERRSAPARESRDSLFDTGETEKDRRRRIAEQKSTARKREELTRRGTGKTGKSATKRPKRDDLFRVGDDM